MGALVAPLVGCTRSDPSPAPEATPRSLPKTRTTPAIQSVAPSDRSPAPPGAAAADESAPARYPWQQVHSPMAPSVAASLAAIARNGPGLRDDVFAKVGDSVTFSDDSLRCFGRARRALGDHGALAATIDHFRGGDGGIDPFRRESRVARIGWSAWQALHGGTASPLVRELSETSPRFALVQFGTNDIEIGALHHFVDHYWNIVDHLTTHGTIPILFTIMPRKDRPDRDAWVPRYNAAIRGIAQARQVPLVDFHHALARLPNGGMAKDGIHPSTHHGARGRDACDFSAEGLRHGYNLRNLLVLQALERARAALGGRAVDTASRRGAGTFADPVELPSLPAVDSARLDAPAGERSDHGCAGARPAPGPEFVLRLTLEEPTTLRISGFDRNQAEIDLALLADDAPRSCLAWAERVIVQRVPPGRYWVVADRAKGAAEGKSAEVVVTVLRD